MRGDVNGKTREAPISGPLRNLWVVVVVALVGWSAVMWIAERVGKRDRPESSLNLNDAVIIGLVQCVALIPGVSRSRATISARLFAGFGPGRGNAAGVLSRRSGSGCLRGVRGDQGSLRDQYGGRLLAHRAGSRGSALSSATRQSPGCCDSWPSTASRCSSGIA